MQRQIQLESMDLVPLNHNEKQEMEGGIVGPVLRLIGGYIAGKVVDSAVDSYIKSVNAAGERAADYHYRNHKHQACDNV